MKKWLMLFVMIDFVFVGLVLKYSNQPNRQIASVENSDGASDQNEMTDGQKSKLALTQSFQLNLSQLVISVTSDKLQMICETSSIIELKFEALNVAYAGAKPTIQHDFSCANIKKDLSTRSLETKIDDFKSMRKNKKIDLAGSSLLASQVYSDEEFPEQWKLTEINITGPATFSINRYELEHVHAANFEFTITSVK